MEEEICNVGREGFGTIPIEDSNGGTSMSDGIPKVNFGRREIKNRGDAECKETKGLEVREGSPLKVVIGADEERRRGKTCVESRKWPVIWTVHKLA